LLNPKQEWRLLSAASPDSLTIFRKVYMNVWIKTRLHPL
jgi:hypothetical protein